MKLKIQMRMLGAVVVLYTMIIISGFLSPKKRKVGIDRAKQTIAFYKKELDKFNTQSI